MRKKYVKIEPIDMGETGKKTPENKNFTIDQIMNPPGIGKGNSRRRFRDQYDLDAPYQRKPIWKEERKIKLIDAICKGVAINAIHVSKSERNLNQYIVIDGVQRLSTIHEFIKDEFRIPFRLTNGEILNLNFSEIEEKSDNDKNCFNFLNKFWQCQITHNVYETISIEDQKELFDYINQQEQLTADEKRYTSRHRTRFFLNFVLSQTLQKKDFLKERLTKNVIENIQCAGTRFTHELLILYAGYGLNEDPSARKLYKKAIDDSCDEIENKLINIFKEKIDFERSDIDQLFIKGSIDQFDKIIDKVITALQCTSYKEEEKDGIILAEINNLLINKVIPANLFLDLFHFFMKHDKNFKSISITQNGHQFALAIREYIDMGLRKSDNRTDSKHSETIMIRYNYLCTLLEKYGLKLDLGKNFNSVEKNGALLNANLFDPYSKTLLTSNNVQIDHDKGKYNDYCKPVAINKNSNNQKGGLNPEIFKNL